MMSSRFWSQMTTCIRFWVGLVVPYTVTMKNAPRLAYFSQKCALFLEYRLVDRRLLHVHQLFDPVLERTNQTHPYISHGFFGTFRTSYVDIKEAIHLKKSKIRSTSMLRVLAPATVLKCISCPAKVSRMQYILCYVHGRPGQSRVFLE